MLAMRAQQILHGVLIRVALAVLLQRAGTDSCAVSKIL